jgi:hypothetical protein
MKLKVVGEPGERDMLGANPKGYIIITPDPRMMAFLAADGRQPSKSEPEAAAMLQSMIAYTGRVTVDADKFTTDVELSWNQIYVGKPQVRFYSIDQDRLTIRSPEQDAGTMPGKRVVGTLTFVRQN